MIRLALVVLALVAVPGAALAAGEDGGPSFFWSYVNLAVLIGVLIYVARKPILDYLSDRRSRVQEDLASTENLLNEAESRLAEWSAKTERLDADIEEIQRISHRRAEDERVKILEDAKRAAERIRSDAGTAIERELRRARVALREEAADLAVELAGKMLSQQVTDADRDRLVDEFVERLERSSGASGGA